MKKKSKMTRKQNKKAMLTKKKSILTIVEDFRD